MLYQFARYFSVAVLVAGLPADGIGQDVPVVGQSARLTRFHYCADRDAGFRCAHQAVRGVIHRISLDTIVVNIGRPRGGLLAAAWTGRYADSLIQWTMLSPMKLEVLAERQSRLQGGVRTGVAAGLLGAKLGLLGSGLVIGICAATQDCRWSDAALMAVITPPLFGVTIGAFGLVIGYLRTPGRWETIGPGAGAISIGVTTR